MENKIKASATLCLGFLLLIFLSFFWLQRTNVYNETLFLQKQVDPNGEITTDAYLLNQNHINLSEIRYFSIVYQVGSEDFSTDHLEYQNGLLHLLNIDLLNLSNLNTKAILYGKKIIVWNYLIGSLQ